MTSPARLLAKIYGLPQSKFDAIPGSPWVYWINEQIRNLFVELPGIGEIAQPRQGMATADNTRFLRYWWEVGQLNILRFTKSSERAKLSQMTWFPYMKGGSYLKWYGNQEYVLNYKQDGKELKAWADPLYGNSGWSRIIKSTDKYFQEGITWGDLNPTGFSVRYLPAGFVFDVKGSSGFPESQHLFICMAIMNSSWMAYALGMLNPTAAFQVGDISRVPFATPTITQELRLNSLVTSAIRNRMIEATFIESTFDFVLPLKLDIGFQNSLGIKNRLATLESQIDDEIFILYGISPEDRTAIQVELAGGALIDKNESDEGQNVEVEEETLQSMGTEELAARWVSYAVGIVLGRFMPGVIVSREKRLDNSRRALGSAVYYREDFAIGSLPAPSEEELNELVGTPDQFSYVDEYGGRHVFTAQVEQSLQALAFEDGIAVLEAGHLSDLVVRVAKALTLMLGEHDTAEVVEALGGQPSAVETFLRKFLERDYFTQWHFKWYRKRPIYWPIQSAKRSYGFVLFHEKITRDTFYTIQREPFLDTKRNAVALKIGDLQGLLTSATGSTRKKLEKDLDDLRKLSTELEEFAKELETITIGGYNPTPEWIDDGVIMRLAPLWKVIPIWKTEPKKYWERLEAGDFDWSHIAMNYWPKRVKAKCKTNKSYAIAHGHEEWYEGK